MQCKSLREATDHIFARLRAQGAHAIRLASPLGLGKPNQLINAIYDRVQHEKGMTLDIYTALSLDIPEAKSDAERRFIKPFVERMWGKDYPRLQYLQDLKKGGLPKGINLHEFYVSAGAFKNSPYVQQHYLAINYTHVARNLVEQKINVIVQLVAQRGSSYSLSSNTDLTLDILDLAKREGRTIMMVGVVHPELPYLAGDAEVTAEFFDCIVASPEVNHRLFAVPREALNEVDTLIGLQASRLVKDGGTLQIGIGSLSDAIVEALLIRHQKNQKYLDLIATLTAGRELGQHERELDLKPFKEGLYGTSEMVMDGFMHLRKAGILTRTVVDGGKLVYIHGGFLLGSRVFYEWLAGLQDFDFKGFSMTRVSKVNDLYDPDENSLRRQRKAARFFNTCMQITALGAAASETLEDGTIISGVGGQYNFVAMAHELEGALSILMLRSTSVRGGKRVSNIVWNHGNATIPRHLRDVVVTEYGIAFLRGKSDEDTIISLLNITDSEFQDDLLKVAKKHRKVRADYEIPEWAKHNHFTEARRKLEEHPGFFKKFPFGSDFTEEELRLVGALTVLNTETTWGKLKFLLKGLLSPRSPFSGEMDRMGYGPGLGLKERFTAAALLGSLHRAGVTMKNS